MALDTSINRQALIGVFPDLAQDINFKILSDCTYQYNCIAWAMGYTDRWVDILTDLPGHWWPLGVVKDMTPEALIEAFKAEGFELSDNCLPEKDYSKVVLYKNATGKWTHAARIITANVEHSKFGPAWDGQHSHNVLCNTTAGQEHQSYGIAYAYMKRQNTIMPTTSPAGKITVNLENLNKLKTKLSSL